MRERPTTSISGKKKTQSLFEKYQSVGVEPERTVRYILYCIAKLSYRHNNNLMKQYNIMSDEWEETIIKRECFFPFIFHRTDFNKFTFPWQFFDREIGKNIINILFFISTITEALTKSQFPVYTIYAQRICLANAAELCAQRSWAYEMVPAFQMSAYVREKRRAATRRACMELCLNERSFQCRYYE